MKFSGFESTFRETVSERLNELRAFYKINDTKVARVFSSPDQSCDARNVGNNFFEHAFLMKRLKRGTFRHLIALSIILLSIRLRQQFTSYVAF